MGIICLASISISEKQIPGLDVYREGNKKENLLPQTKVSTISSSFKLKMLCLTIGQY